MEDAARTLRIAASKNNLAARWVGADKQLLRQIFPLLARGQPVGIDQIAERTGATTAVVEEALLRGRVGRDPKGRVVELSGLMLSPTLHRVEVGGVALFSCCALLAHMTPLFLDSDVILESVDPQSRAVIRLELSPKEVAAHTPASAVGSFVEAEPEGVATDVGANFCSHVHHFTDAASAASYLAADARRFLVEITELRAAAEDLYHWAWT